MWRRGYLKLSDWTPLFPARGQTCWWQRHPAATPRPAVTKGGTGANEDNWWVWMTNIAVISSRVAQRDMTRHQRDITWHPAVLSREGAWRLGVHVTSGCSRLLTESHSHTESTVLIARQSQRLNCPHSTHSLLDSGYNLCVECYNFNYIFLINRQSNLVFKLNIPRTKSRLCWDWRIYRSNKSKVFLSNTLSEYYFQVE